jgi:hypothetical protein
VLHSELLLLLLIDVRDGCNDGTKAEAVVSRIVVRRCRVMVVVCRQSFDGSDGDDIGFHVEYRL